MPTTPLPFFLNSDILWLDSAFMIHTTKRRLIDTSLGVFHSCSQEALPLLEMLRYGTSLSRLQAKASEQNITTPELCLLLGFLNNCGALRRKRSLKYYGKAWWASLTNLSYGLRYDPLTWRRNLNLTSITWGSLRACSTLIASTVLLDCLLVELRRWSLLSIIEYSTASLIIFVCSIVVHECAHARIIAHWGHSVVVIQHGFHIGLLHARLSRGVEIISALAGPLCGGVFSLSAALFLYSLHTYSLAILALAMSILHIAGLLPWYGDGRSLWIAFRQGADKI